MKNRLVVMLTACLFLQFGHSQGWSTYKPHTVDFIFGIDHGYVLLNGTDDAPTTKSLVANRNRMETSKSNIRFGLNYNFMLQEKLFLKTGFRYVKTGYRSSVLYLPGEQNDSPNVAATSFKGYRFDYIFIELPLALRYVYSENWCKSYIEAGLAANHYLHTRVSSKKVDIQPFNVEGMLNTWSWSASLAIGAEFLIADYLPVFVQLTSRYQPVERQEEPIQEQLVSMGVESGVRFAF